jgi:tetratricopeptide (TPR) repeat protein
VARIYISATYGDLKEHREKAYGALRQLGHDAIAMEDYVATDQRPLAKCLEDVAACDLYVGIFAHRYGHVPNLDNPEGRSITELEYRHAQTLGIPRLVFLLDPDTPWPPPRMDAVTGEGNHGARIRALRKELTREQVASFFTTPDQLAQQISTAVTNQLTPRQGTYQLRRGLPAVAIRRSWTIPPPVPSFTGRDEQLAALHAQLTSQGAATLVPTAALYGMGGVGKTQLALAYAKRYRADYGLGWWVPSETELGMVAALADLGMALGLPEALRPAELAAGARDALGERSGWLLIFDNAPDPVAVADYLPGSGGGHVLVTSRDSAWQGIADPVPVDLLAREAAVGLLLRRSGDVDQQAAERLAEALGRLPLALEQAAAYAAAERLSLARYLELFTVRRADLLALGRPLAYQVTVDATFTLALDQLRVANPAAGRLLELCALFAPDEIPVPLLLSKPQLLPDPLAAAVADPVRQGEVVGLLYRQGLLTRDTGDTARIHRLVQAVTLAHLSPADRHQRTLDAVKLLAQLFPYRGRGLDADEWPRCARLLPHAQAALDHARTLQLADPAVATLLERTAQYLWRRHAAPPAARSSLEWALQLRHSQDTKETVEYAETLHLLANVIDAQRELDLARQLHQQALEIRQRLYGHTDHKDIVWSLNSLATDLYKSGKTAGAQDLYERARELHEQALAMLRRLHGPDTDHKDIAWSLNSLGNDLRELGELEGARQLHEQALEMRRRLYGPDTDHVLTGASIYDLSIDLRELGELEQARELGEQELAMLRRLYGEDADHSNIADALEQLAMTLSALGEVEKARELDEQAEAMRQRLAER